MEININRYFETNELFGFHLSPIKPLPQTYLNFRESINVGKLKSYLLNSVKDRIYHGLPYFSYSFPPPPSFVLELFDGMFFQGSNFVVDTRSGYVLNNRMLDHRFDTHYIDPIINLDRKTQVIRLKGSVLLFQLMK